MIFVPCIFVLCAVGVFLGALHRPASHLLVPKHFFGYLAFCLLQQVALSSYSANRLFAATGSELRTSMIAGALFGALHWPNPVLIPLTWMAEQQWLGFLCANAHSPAHALSGYSWHAGLVGISGRVAPCDARGAWFLSLSPAMTGDEI